MDTAVLLAQPLSACGLLHYRSPRSLTAMRARSSLGTRDSKKKSRHTSSPPPLSPSTISIAGAAVQAARSSLTTRPPGVCGAAAGVCLLRSYTQWATSVAAQRTSVASHHQSTLPRTSQTARCPLHSPRLITLVGTGVQHLTLTFLLFLCLLSLCLIADSAAID